MRKVVFKENRAGSNCYFSSGDVFTDLGFPDAEEMRMKAQLSVAINRILESRDLAPKYATKLLGIKKSKIADLQNYKLDKFSVTQLLAFATALEHDVVIELRPHVAFDPAARVVEVEAA